MVELQLYFEGNASILVNGIEYATNTSSTTTDIMLLAIHQSTDTIIHRSFDTSNSSTEVE